MPIERKEKEQYLNRPKDDSDSAHAGASIDPTVSLGQITTIAVAVVYISGYLIAGLFLKEHGITQLPLADIVYLEKGLVFIIIIGITGITPVFLVRRELQRNKNKLKHNNVIAHYVISVATVLITVNYLYALTFIAIFATSSEWTNEVFVFTRGFSLRFIFSCYSLSLFVLLAFVHSSRRLDLVKRINNKTRVKTFLPKRWYWRKNILKFIFYLALVAAFILTALFDYTLISTMPWFFKLTFVSKYFIAWVFLSIVALYLLRFFGSQYKQNRRKLGVWLLGMPFVLALYVFIVLSYATGPYMYIPVSRGGGLPLTAACLYLAQDANVSDELRTTLDDRVFIIRQAHRLIYFLDPNDWSRDDRNWPRYIRNLKQIRELTVEAIIYHKILNGAPRIGTIDGDC